MTTIVTLVLFMQRGAGWIQFSLSADLEKEFDRVPLFDGHFWCGFLMKVMYEDGCILIHDLH